MMGTPFNYEYLFDDPCDVEFHDCMWSGMCTCCMQFLHQASYFEELSMVTKGGSTINNNNLHPSSNQNSITSNTTTIQQQTHHQTNNANHQANQQHYQNHHISEVPTANGGSGCSLSKLGSLDHHSQLHQHHTTPANQLHHHQHNIKQHQQINIAPQLIDEQLKRLASRNIEEESNINEEPKLKDLSGVISPSTTSSSSPKPIRRREHNDSERKRRDHLRNAFNFLRDQVPRFKALNKKPPRIQILHEATLYVENIKKEAKELERRLHEERMKNQSLLTNYHDGVESLRKSPYK